MLEGAGHWQPASPSLVQTRRWANSPSPVQPERQATFEDLSSDPSPEMVLKVVDQSCHVDGHHSPSPSSDLNKTTQVLDLTQPMEEDDCASLSGNSDETVDWSQSAGGDLGDPPVLDPHMHEFLSGTEASSSTGDEPNPSAMPKPPFDNP